MCKIETVGWFGWCYTLYIYNIEIKKQTNIHTDGVHTHIHRQTETKQDMECIFKKVPQDEMKIDPNEPWVRGGSHTYNCNTPLFGLRQILFEEQLWPYDNDIIDNSKYLFVKDSCFLMQGINFDLIQSLKDLQVVYYKADPTSKKPYADVKFIFRDTHLEIHEANTPKPYIRARFRPRIYYGVIALRHKLGCLSSTLKAGLNNFIKDLH